MKIEKFNQDGIQGLSIEIDGRGADFYADGSVCAWDGNGMFSQCAATGMLNAFIEDSKLRAAFTAASEGLGIEIPCRIGWTFAG